MRNAMNSSSRMRATKFRRAVATRKFYVKGWARSSESAHSGNVDFEAHAAGAARIARPDLAAMEFRDQPDDVEAQPEVRPLARVRAFTHRHHRVEEPRARLLR